MLEYNPINVSNSFLVCANIEEIALSVLFLQLFTLVQERASVVAKAEALLSQVEADVKFLEELETQSMVKGLPEYTLTTMLRELNEMLRQLEVNQNISITMLKKR